MTVTETQVQAATLAISECFKKWSGHSPAGAWAESMARAALTAALSDMVVVPVEVIHRFSRHYELNECRKRKPDDALEIPIYDLRDLIAAAPPPVSAGE